MRKEIAGFHYLTEALADGLLKRAGPEKADPGSQIENELNKLWRDRHRSPWTIAELVERSARAVHEKLKALIDASRPLFAPILDELDEGLSPRVPFLLFGGLSFSFAGFDFKDDGSGASRFLEHIWDSHFTMSEARNKAAAQINELLLQGIHSTHFIISYVLERAAATPSNSSSIAKTPSWRVQENVPASFQTNSLPTKSRL